MQYLKELKRMCQEQRKREVAKQHLIDDDRSIFGSRISPLDGSVYMPMRFPDPSLFDRVEREHIRTEDGAQIVDISTDLERGVIEVRYASGKTFELL